MHSLLDSLTDNAVRLGEKTAFEDGTARLSWRALAGRVGGAAATLGPERETIGIAGGNGVEWAVAFLAACIAGKTIVPAPSFFSPAQISALVADAGITRILVAGRAPENLTGHSAILQELSQDNAPLPAQGREHEGGLVIYTSGSTGRPKGVRLALDQALWTAKALATLTQATRADRYLSLLPLSMLLEIICAIIVPVLAGGRVTFAPRIADAVISGGDMDLVSAFETARPTMTVMVPQLLGLYAAQLAQGNRTAPESLRFAAVGGAPLPPAIAQAAQKTGIPFFEGYGLSECGSVVALNRPGMARPGTSGQPLPGLSVEIEDGEITVSGPPVMQGYLHGGPAPRRWRTGDLGAFDKEGFLRVFGRKDNLLVTQAGRNISPEWIETMLAGHPMIAACIVTLAGERGLGALIVPRPHAADWFSDTGGKEILHLIRRACAPAPVYAHPRWVRIIPQETAMRGGLLTPDGRIQRAAAARYAMENT